MTGADTILQNRYRIEKQIGQGGMGKVYVAVDERFRSTVAIKETVFEDANLRKAFEREARLLNSLKHPALPRVSDHFNEGDGQFLVMEYIAGEDLAETMERSGEAFPLDAVLNWAEQLCGALEYLHRQNIIHRDIKPQNLKLTGDGHVVLLDFGLAKGNASDSPHQTVAKSIFGYSRSYASLEQIQGTGTEPRSDLYSLGATLYHLLTAEAPADALTRAMNVLNGQADPLTAPHLLNKNVPVEVSEILLKTMALNAGERPESAAALRSLLEHSDKEILKKGSKVILPNASTTDFLTQNTKLFGAATNIENRGRSSVKTLIAAENAPVENSRYETSLDSASDSVATNVQPLAANAKNPKPSRMPFAAALGALLLVAIGISAAYFHNPAGIKANSDAESESGEVKSNFVNEEQKAGVLNANAANKKADTSIVNNNPQTTDAKPRTAETTQNRGRQTKAQPEKSSSASKNKAKNAGGDELIINGESIETGGMIIDENGIRMKNQPLPSKPPKPPVESKDLTPAQLERLKKIGNGKLRVVIAKTPEPED